ncbi:hypothetical protein [Thiohalomonas denitrificans]|uniref:hypothetical protein n=1 Tax=Thiohalomonas denitrificans TaxID=415747 RepID=UPI0026F34FD8|nr:hypothetical protein [Thiohalomonas denitrificans]
MKISVVSKQPPGGRCNLYMRFADAAAAAIDGRAELLYPVPRFPRPEEPLPPPPALLVDRKLVEPADGVILSPEEVCAAISAAGYSGAAAALLEILEAEQERMMEEWEGD